MTPRPSRSTRTDTRFPSTTLFRSTVATGDVLYHAPDRRMLQDVVTCIREKCTIDELGERRERFADRHLKTGQEMERLFRRSEEHTSELQSLMRISYAVFCLKTTTKNTKKSIHTTKYQTSTMH